MASFCKVIMVGNLTRDPELRYTPKGMAVCQAAIAINRHWTAESGEKKEEVTFVDFTAWGRTGETLAQYMRKGGAILVEGRLRLEAWDDRQTGQKRQKLSVVAEAIQFLGAPQGDGDEPRGQGRPAPSRSPQEARQAAAKDSAETDGAPPPDDDVPF